MGTDIADERTINATHHLLFKRRDDTCDRDLAPNYELNIQLTAGNQKTPRTASTVTGVHSHAPSSNNCGPKRPTKTHHTKSDEIAVSLKSVALATQTVNVQITNSC
jgi:hypothetical protein